MSSRNSEQERLKRIRDRQIQLRDPQTKVNNLQHSIARRRKKSLTSFSLRTMIDETPNKFLGLVLGLTIGIVVLIIVPDFVEPPWGDVIGFAAIIFLAILGFMLGQAMDARDSIKEWIE
ncbi:MAG: hypothetical protein P8Z42_10620 [Anaerolineales bacterium]|jgi:uncharacterized protein YacL